MDLWHQDQEPYGHLDTDLITIDLENKNAHHDHDMDSCEIGDDGFFTKRSLSDLDSLSVDDCFNDEGPPIEDDIDDGGKDHPLNGAKAGKDGDHVLAEIKDCISRRQSGPKSAGSSTASSDGSPQVKVFSQFVSIPFGIVPRASYEHGKRCSDIMGVSYNARMRQFLILDSKGITTWKRDAVDHRVNRALQYPKYEYRLITNVVYAKKYNCYFVLTKDFALKVFNKDFLETCSVHADLRSVLFMLFNPVRDELITGGVGGTKVWRFHQQPGKALTVLKPLANYGLTLKYELPNVGGSWVKRVELDHHLEHLYCCSDTDLHVYDLVGKLLFKFKRAHMMSITGCRYSRNASVLVTSSIDCEVKVWSLMGGLVHTFRGHSRAVTNLIIHPLTSSIVITSSLDGTIRMWSLDTMDCIYSLVVSVDGVVWMGLTDDNLLYLSTARTVTLWNLNYIAQFWALARSRVTRMVTCGCKSKTLRLMAISEDSSVRLMARSNSKNLSTVLPPPNISPLQRVLSVCYSREFNTIYMLINPHEIWVYTTRTDPSCRIAVWDVVDIQAMFLSPHSGGSGAEELKPTTISVNKPAPSHRATENGAGNEMLANCCCIGILNSTAMVWTDEGYCCPIRDSYLLLGLEDGRILFMDPVIKGQKYLEFKTGKDPVLDVFHDVSHNSLITLYKLPTMMQIHIWSLPDLELQHEIYAAPDLRDYARVGYTLVTGHESGCVIFHQLEDATDPGLHKAKMLPVYEEVIEVNHKPEHLAPVINVAVCVPLKIFCSCSNDGAIKIWNEDNALMTEITLDETLSSACFLNNMGDLLIGYQKHVFYIDHTKVCPQLTVPESDVESFDKESFICEDPAVMYEGVTPNPDPVTLENYLVPFDIEFSKDFLEGKVKLEPEPVKVEESDDESVISMAATETYLSPDSTPRRRLSLVDHMLGSEASKYDLLKQMKKTLQHLAEKEKKEAAQLAHEQRLEEESKLPAYQRKRRRQLRKAGQIDASDGLTPLKVEDKKEGEDVDNEDDYEHFSFPRFGESPGATPVSSTAATPEVLSEEETEEVPTKPKEDLELKLKIRATLVNQEDDIGKFLATAENESKAKERGSTESLPPKRNFGLSDIKVDAETLMKDAKKAQASAAAVKRNVEQTPARKVVESDSDVGEKKTPRREKPIKKKMMDRSQRKAGKQKKSDQEKRDSTEPPPTQMQALEQREQKLSVTSKASIEAEERQRAQQELTDAEAWAKIDKKFENEMRETDGIKRRPQQHVELDKTKVAVPDLPTVPDNQGEKETRIPSASEAKASLMNKMGGRSAIDFGHMDKKQQSKDGSDVLVDGGGEGSKTELSGSRAVTADSAVHVDGTSVVSSLSGDGGQAFRIGLMSKELPETSGFEDGASPSQAVKTEKTLLSVETNKVEPNIRECRRDSNVAKQTGDKNVSKKKDVKNKKKLAPNGHKGPGKERKLSSSSRPKSSVGQKIIEKPAEKNPEDLLNAYFEKKKAKEEEKHAVKIISANDAEEMLRNIGKPKTLPVVDETRPISSMSNIDHQAFMAGGITSTPDGGSKKFDNRVASPDTSTLRTTTPSLSIIENESLRSTSPTLSLTKSVSVPVPSQSKVPLTSSPVSTISEASDPGSKSVSPIKMNEGSLSTIPESEIKRSPVEDLDKKMETFASSSFSEKPSLQNKSVDTVDGASKSFDSFTLTDVKLKQVESDKSKSSQNLTISKNDEPTLTSEIQDVSKDAKNKGLDNSCNSSLKSENTAVALNIQENIEVSVRPTETGKRISQTDAMETSVHFENSTEEKGDEIRPQPVSSENKEERTPKTSPRKCDPISRQLSSTISMSPSSLITDQIKEEDEDKEDDMSSSVITVTVSHTRKEGDTPEKDEAETLPSIPDTQTDEESEKSWDSDFDHFSLSNDSFGISSSLSFSDENDPNDKRNGTASSSSNAETLLQVKIRKKMLIHSRIKKKPEETKIERPQISTLTLRRKFSQNDALTVQRNAYLEGLRSSRKRAQSAVEGSSSLKNQQTSGTQRPKSSMNQCVLCAAEGVKNHANHAKLKRAESVEKDKRKISFQSDAAAEQDVKQAFSTPRDPLPIETKEEPEPLDAEEEEDCSTNAQTDGMRTPSMSDLWATPRGKTPTTIDTPDPSYTRPPSQMLSDTSFQPPTLSPEPLFDGLEESEAAFESRAESRQKEDFDQSETRGGSPDSGWTDRDLVSVSRQGDDTQSGTEDQDIMDLRIKSAAQPQSENLLTQSEKDEAKARPQTSLEDKILDRPELQNALTYFRQRPNTAERRFKTEDLQTAFDTSLGKYKRMARTPLASDKLYKNDDQAFSEFWHERQIERHMLIRMQKELRAQNVQKRREAMELKKQERLTQHLVNDHNHSVQDRRTMASQPPPSPYLRANTVHGTRPVMTIPAPTPVSSRPHTATGNYDQFPQQPLPHPHTQPHPHPQSRPPVTLQQQIHQTLEKRSRQTETELIQRGKAELGQEKAFRCRLRQQPPEMEGGEVSTTIDPWLIDPRNPHALRPKSSKSIPSKCHRYVLVTKPKTKLYYPLPTPLEEQLLATRFPGQGERVFRQYEGLLFRPPRRPIYGIEYSPYEHQLYG